MISFIIIVGHLHTVHFKLVRHLWKITQYNSTRCSSSKYQTCLVDPEGNILHVEIPTHHFLFMVPFIHQSKADVTVALMSPVSIWVWTLHLPTLHCALLYGSSWIIWFYFPHCHEDIWEWTFHSFQGTLLYKGVFQKHPEGGGVRKMGGRDFTF